MMRIILKSSLVWAGILLPFASRAQDVPLGALPMQFNSSFAGEAESPRLNANTRFDGSGTTFGRLLTISNSYDQFVPALRSGVGVSSYYSKQDKTFSFSGQTSSFEGYNYGFAVAVAPKFSLKGKYTISPSLDFSYSSFRSSYDNYWPTFTNERQNASGFSIQSRVAILFNTQKWYAGYSVDLFQYGETHYSIPVTFPNAGRQFNSYWQFGYTFQRSSESKFSFTPQLLFRTGYDTPSYGNQFLYFRFTAFNLNFRYQKVIWGISNAGFHVGWQTKPLRIMLSSRFENGDFSGRSYIGNLSFRYVFKGKE